jgi:hypothetical protein
VKGYRPITGIEEGTAGKYYKEESATLLGEIKEVM